MARKGKSKAKKRGRPAAKRRGKRPGRGPSRKAAARRPARPSLSREALEEIVVLSAKSEGAPLSDMALSEIAACANLDPARVIEAHRQLSESTEQPGVAVLRLVEIWPDDEE